MSLRLARYAEWKQAKIAQRVALFTTKVNRKKNMRENDMYGAQLLSMMRAVSLSHPLQITLHSTHTPSYVNQSNCHAQPCQNRVRKYDSTAQGADVYCRCKA